MTTRASRYEHGEGVAHPRGRSGDGTGLRSQAVAESSASSASDPMRPGPTLSVAQAAELLGVSRWLVQQAVRDGVLPHVRLGRRILISRARLLDWLADS